MLLSKIIPDLHRFIELDSPPRRIRDIVEKILLEQVGELEAYELIDRYTSRIERWLRQERSRLLEDGADSWFEFHSSSEYCIPGPYFVELRDPPATQEAKRNRLHMAPLREILESVNFSEFETIASAVISLLGT